MRQQREQRWDSTETHCQRLAPDQCCAMDIDTGCRRWNWRGAACRGFALGLALAGMMLAANADDWPQWMGPQRDDVWREKGILEKFPAGGPPILWRTNVNRGYCGPAVVAGRLYMPDRL